MLVLFETPAGYAIFKLLDEKKLEKTENLYKAFETPEKAGRIVKLKHFEKFLDTSEALAATTATVEGKISKKLKKVLKRHITEDLQEKLLVADPKLGSAIKNKFSVQCVANTSVQELMRCIRSQLDSLISELPKKDMTAMTLGLAHSLSRYKLKFSPDKIDTMIVQAVSLLGDLDKEINNYVMRLREWYGWHFPELGKIVSDHITFAKVIKIIGTKDHTSTADLSDILPEEIEEQVKEAAEISMGSEISDYDIIMIQRLCDEIIENINYRASLFAYIQGRMMAIAPNVTVLVGELVGARLMAHAGSLVNLAKRAASTIQILGAEKALFRALKTKHNTPKYGIIYHAELVGQSHDRNKGKMSRMLAAKVALATRVDALGEDGTFTLGVDHKAKLEARLRVLEQGITGRISGTGKAKAKFEKYHGKSELMQYPAAADSTLPSTSGTQSGPSGSKRKRPQTGMPKDEDDSREMAEETPKQKKKKLKRELWEAGLSEERAGPSGVTPGPSGIKASPSGVKIEDLERSPKKKKQKGKQILDQSTVGEVIEGEDESTSSKKKKKVKQELEPSESMVEETEQPTSSKKKKKIKHELEMSVEPEPTSSEQATPTSLKKKKKKKVRPELETEVEATEVLEPEPQQSAQTSPKKKKKKTRQEVEESETSAVAIEEPTSTKKKKKKKVRQEVGESIEGREVPVSEGKQKKKKKEYDSD